MGQYYVFANVSKCQTVKRFFMLKALEFFWDWAFQIGLFLLLLHLDGATKHSLQHRCLYYLYKNKEKYPPDTFERLLPQNMLSKMDFAFLIENFVGAWVGDRLIVSGDYSEFSPFPPDGEWRRDCLFELVDKEFSETHFRNVLNLMCEIEKLMRRLQVYENETVYVVNLDKKEYIDPQKYTAGEKTVLDIIQNKESNGVMAGLFILITHSTGKGGGDFPESVVSKGTWAGNRIAVCTPGYLDNFETYSDVSNPKDVDRCMW